MRTTESQRLILASLAATAALAFALGAATVLWLVSPHVRTAAGPLPLSSAAAQILPLAAAAGISESPGAAASGATDTTDAGGYDTAFPGTPDQATSPVVPTQPPALPAGAAQAPPAATSIPPASDRQTIVSPAAAPAKAPSVPSPLMLDRGQAYQVHLGAFRDAQAAERLRSMVSDQGFEIAIVERPIGNGETWLLAVSADFADRTDALRLAARLHREIGIDPLVIRAPVIAGDAG